MLTTEHRIVLRELALYTTFLAGALSPTAVPTFCELLFGSMLSGHGFITQALLSIPYECTWSSYHHWISHGKWCWKDLSRQLLRLVSSKVKKDKVVSLLLDDWVIERFSEKAPACRLHHQHSRKRNRPAYLWGQCWVTLSIVFQRACDEVFTAIPVMAFPAPASGNVSKLKIAVAMLKVVRQELYELPLRLLTDCWFMNSTLMQPVLELGIEVIGQIPKNRALYALPPVPAVKKRGRPRKYGVKMTPEEVEKLPEFRVEMWMYGKLRTVRYRTCICRAHFLKGQVVRVVWSRFENEKGLTETRLFLSTNRNLAGDEVLRAYSKRWPTEPLFQQLKHIFGCCHLWQRKLRTLLRWMHIKLAGYALLQLLTVCKNEAAVVVASIPWRNQNTSTAGMMRNALSSIIPQFNIREGWNRYRQKYEFDFEKLTNRSNRILTEAA